MWSPDLDKEGNSLSYSIIYNIHGSLQSHKVSSQDLLLSYFLLDSIWGDEILELNSLDTVILVTHTWGGGGADLDTNQLLLLLLGVSSSLYR